MAVEQPVPEASPKSAMLTLVLCMFLGFSGAHRFYLNKNKTGLLMLLTLGGLGLWMIADTVKIVCNEFTDGANRVILFNHGNDRPGKLVLGIVSILLSFSIAASTYVTIYQYYSTDPVTRAVMMQLAAIRDGEFEKAYQFNSPEFQKATSYKAFKQLIDEYDALKYNEGINITSVEVTDFESHLKGIVFSTKDSVPIEFKLIYENGIYKILNIQITPYSTDAGRMVERSAPPNQLHS